MSEQGQKKGNTLRNLLLAAIAIALLLLDFGIGSWAGKNAANKAISDNPGTTIKTASINNNGDLVITLSTGETINVGNVKGEPGRDGVDGTNGTNGSAGSKGADGKNGTDGKDGTGITSTVINENGELVITLSDGTTTNLGAVKGEKGGKGDPGNAGGPEDDLCSGS